MIIDGEKAPPFSASTLRMPDPENDQTQRIIEMTRAKLASSREAVDADIRTRTAGGNDEGSRAVGSGEERKPNKELLGALRNPSLPAPAASAPRRLEQPRRDDRRSSGGEASASRPPERDNRGGERKPASAPYRPPAPASAAYRPVESREPAMHRIEGEAGVQPAPTINYQSPAPVIPAPPIATPITPLAAQPLPATVHTIEPGQPVSFR
jgi:hypothetical protein